MSAGLFSNRFVEESLLVNGVALVCQKLKALICLSCGFLTSQESQIVVSSSNSGSSELATGMNVLNVPSVELR